MLFSPFLSLTFSLMSFSVPGVHGVESEAVFMGPRVTITAGMLRTVSWNGHKAELSGWKVPYDPGQPGDPEAPLALQAPIFTQPLLGVPPNMQNVLGVAKTPNFSFSPDEGSFIFMTRPSFRMWDANTGEQVSLKSEDGGRGLEQLFVDVKTVVFSPCRRYVLAGYFSSGIAARIWDLTDGKLVHELNAVWQYPGSAAGVWTASFEGSDDGSYKVILGSVSGHVQLWDLSLGSTPSRENYTVLLHDPSSGSEGCGLAHRGGTIRSVILSPDGKWLATTSTEALRDRTDPTAKIWNLQNIVHAETLEGPPGAPRIATLPPLKLPSVAHWDIREGYVSVDKIVFSPNGKKLVTYALNVRDRTSNVFELARGDTWREVEPERTMEHSGGKNCEWGSSVSFSPDEEGKFILTTGPYQLPTVWRSDTKEPVATLMSSRKSVAFSGFSADGRKAMAARYSGRDRRTVLDVGRFLEDDEAVCDDVQETTFTTPETDEVVAMHVHMP